MYLYDFGIRLGTTTKTEDLHMAGRPQKSVPNKSFENTKLKTLQIHMKNQRILRCCLQPISFLFSNAHWAHLLKEIGTWINWYVGCALCFSFWGCTQLKVTLWKKDSYMCSKFWFLLLRPKKKNIMRFEDQTIFLVRNRLMLFWNNSVWFGHLLSTKKW